MKAKRKRTQAVKSTPTVQPTKPEKTARGGWIAPKAGVWIIAIASLACAAWTGWQVSQFKPPLESILWGILFGATIWLVAGFAYAINRWIRRS